MISFYNIKSGETRNCETEPQIAAFWGVSDRSPNASGGQDFSWRLAPAVVVEVNKIKKDTGMLEKIAARKGVVDNVNETDILEYISFVNSGAASKLDQGTEAFKEAYVKEIQELEAPTETKKKEAEEEEKVAEKTVEDEESEAPEQTLVKDALLAKTRTEMNDIATGMGIKDPKSFNTKEELAAAIRKA